MYNIRPVLKQNLTMDSLSVSLWHTYLDSSDCIVLLGWDIF